MKAMIQTRHPQTALFFSTSWPGYNAHGDAWPPSHQSFQPRSQGLLRFIPSEFNHRQPKLSLNEPHKEHNMASNCMGLYGIFYKISMKVVQSENIQ